jgi:hypothetical protein
MVYTCADGFIGNRICVLFYTKIAEVMDRDIKKFITRILIAGIVMVILGWIVFTYLLPGKYLPVLPWMLAFFAITAILTHAWQVKQAKKKMGLFTRNSMIVSLLRLMLYSAFALIYLANNQENAVVFVVCLVFVYSLFTILEVSEISRMVKSKQ